MKAKINFVYSMSLIVGSTLAALLIPSKDTLPTPPIPNFRHSAANDTGAPYSSSNPCDNDEL